MKEKPTLLIVDDDKDLLRQLEFLLEDDFDKILLSSSKADALELAKEKIDICLADVRLSETDSSNIDGIELAKELRGIAAIASAKEAYQVYKEAFSSDRFSRLAAQGARRQRLLWASTGTKDPSYSDVKYVEALIGSDTVNTMPMETLNAYRDHGDPAPRLEESAGEAVRNLRRLAEVGLDLTAITQQLEDEGVRKFADSFDRLTATLKEKHGVAI